MVTGFTKFEIEEFSRKNIQQTIDDYKNYKKWFKFPAGIKGALHYKLKVCKKIKICSTISLFQRHEKCAAKSGEYWRGREDGGQVCGSSEIINPEIARLSHNSAPPRAQSPHGNV